MSTEPSPEQLQAALDKVTKSRQYHRNYAAQMRNKAKAYDELVPHINNLYAIIKRHEDAIVLLQSQLQSLSSSK